MEALQTDEQITPITTIKRHRIAAGRVRHRPRSLDDSGGRSPLIIKDLDLYPQRLNMNRLPSPMLNYEELLSCMIRACRSAMSSLGADSITDSKSR